MKIYVYDYSGQFWVVRRWHTMIHHVDVVRVSQCTLHSAIHEGGRYIPPLAFELAGMDYGRDLKGTIHRYMSTCEENVMTLKTDPSVMEYMILPLWWKGTGK